MLSHGFVNWETDENHGKFSDEFSQQYDILPFRFWSGTTNSIKVESAEGFKIEFSCERALGGFMGIVENSDSFYRARIIQYQKPNFLEEKRNKNRSEYLLFEGYIELSFKGKS